MEPSDYESIPDKPRYIDFPALEHGTIIEGKLALNRWSSRITKGHDFPGAQVSISRREIKCSC
jgi:dihydroxy-acid dehydratase